MADSKEYTYHDFWEMRGRQTIWFTQHVGYRMGAAVALIASRIGLSPNMVSVLSALITVASTMLAVYLGQGSFAAGVVIVLGLQVGYAFDCADGPLARATGQGSSFGILMDKISDLSSGMVFPCVMAYGAGHFYYQLENSRPDYTLRVLLIVLILRVILSVLMWMKELVVYDADRLKEDSRGHTLWWRAKKTVSLYIDEPVYRLGIALAWCAGLFWEFIILYSVGIFLITLVYLASSKKEMDAMDLEKSRSRGV
jgi:phosphatidylglycerophosphate synthase